MKTYPWEKRHPHHFGQRTRNDFILWSIAIVLALGLGIYAGHKVTATYKDTEIVDLRAKLDGANEDLAFWQATLRRVVEDNQVKEPELNGKPMSEKDKEYFFGGHSGFADIFTPPQKESRARRRKP